MKCFKIFGMKENKCVQTGAEKQARSSLLLYQNQTPTKEFKITFKFCTKFPLNFTGKKFQPYRFFSFNSVISVNSEITFVI